MKEVYILKHTHVESNPEMRERGVKPTTLHTLNLVYKLGMEIGIRKKVSSLFCDGQDEHCVENTEQYLKEVREHCGERSNFLKIGMSDMLRQGDMSQFQSMWFALFYGSLRDAGVDISLKPTDISFWDWRKNYGPYIFTEWCMQTGTNPQTVTPEKFQKEILPIETEYRDNYIHEKIITYGTERNILLVGADHKLESLILDRELRIYPVEIEHVEDSTYKITGKLPQDLSDIKERMQEDKYDLSPFLFLGNSARLEERMEFI